MSKMFEAAAAAIRRKKNSSSVEIVRVKGDYRIEFTYDGVEYYVVFLSRFADTFVNRFVVCEQSHGIGDPVFIFNLNNELDKLAKNFIAAAA